MDEKPFFDKIKKSTTGSEVLLTGAYLLHGEEEYAKYQAVRMAQGLVSDAARDLNTQQLQSPTIQQVMDACDSMPFFDRVKVVILTDYPATKDEEQALAEYCPRIPDTTLLLIVKKDKAKATCPYYKLLEAQDRVIEFARYEPAKAGQFIKKRADMRGVSIDPRVSRHIIDMVGVDLAALENAVFRVADYVGQGNPITTEAVDACITPNTEYKVFEVLSNLLSGRKQEGLRILQVMLKNGESAMGIASFMEGRLKQMLSVKRMQKEGMKEQDIIRILGGNPNAAKFIIQDAGKFRDTRRLTRALKAMAAVDYNIKSGTISDQPTALIAAVLEAF